MQYNPPTSRRAFLASAVSGTAAVPFTAVGNIPPQTDSGPQSLPLKIGIRQASLKDPENPKKNMVGNFDTFKVARQVPGIMGVELQIATGDINLRDLDVARRFKREAHRWGLDIPSTAGVFDRGTLKGHWGPAAGLEVEQAIRATELLGASMMLVAFFKQNAPDMNDEASYGPVVDMLLKLAPRAVEAGVVIALENSLSPADNRKLIDIIDHPAVKVYYDFDNMYNFGHVGLEVPGAPLLGTERISIVHVKNLDNLLEEPGRVDWKAALRALTDIGYGGWLVFESRHASHARCISDTEQNIAFIKQHFRMPKE